MPTFLKIFGFYLSFLIGMILFHDFIGYMMSVKAFIIFESIYIYFVFFVVLLLTAFFRFLGERYKKGEKLGRSRKQIISNMLVFHYTNPIYIALSIPATYCLAKFLTKSFPTLREFYSLVYLAIAMFSIPFIFFKVARLLEKNGDEPKV